MVNYHQSESLTQNVFEKRKIPQILDVVGLARHVNYFLLSVALLLNLSVTQNRCFYEMNMRSSQAGYSGTTFTVTNYNNKYERTLSS